MCNRAITSADQFARHCTNQSAAVGVTEEKKKKASAENEYTTGSGLDGRMHMEMDNFSERNGAIETLRQI